MIKQIYVKWSSKWTSVKRYVLPAHGEQPAIRSFSWMERQPLDVLTTLEILRSAIPMIQCKIRQ